MNITEFTALAAEKVEQYLREEMQEEVVVQTEEVRKINDQCLHGLSIEKKGAPFEGDAVPTYYVEEMYHAFLSGADMDDLVQGLAKAYINTCSFGPIPVEKIPDMEYRTIRHRVGLRLVGKDYNKEFLKTVPYKDVGNGYALLCDVKMKASDGGLFGTLVTNDMAEEYHYDIDRLFRDALDNAWKSKSAILRGVNELTRQYAEESGGAEMCLSEETEPDDRETCYVLTTDRPRYGAAALFYPGTQAMIAHVLGEDYVAIPSSLHEFMIVRASKVGDPGFLQQLVREANCTVVGPDEVLSDNILKYSRETGQLSLLTEDDVFPVCFEERLMQELSKQMRDGPALTTQS